MSWRHILALVAIGVFVTWAVTPLVRWRALRVGLIDAPGGRKVHDRAIPRIGGVAIVAGFAAVIVVEALGETHLGWGGGVLAEWDTLWPVLLGLGIIFLVGLLDDIADLGPGLKFAGQLAAAGVVAAWGPRVDFVGNPFGGGLVYLGMLAIPVTVLWIVGFANVINLIDGLDGLAAGVSAIAAATFLVLAMESNQLASAALAAAVIGSCLGFLRYNFAPASIFMGDSGALLLGFALAAISLQGVMKSVAAITLAVPLLVIGVPIFDTATAIIRRVRHKRPIQEADRGHIHHRLLGRGFDQRQTVLIIYTWCIALAVSAYAMRWVPFVVRLGVFVVLAVLSGLMAYWLGVFEAAHQHLEEEHHS